nr:MAG TPA: hypothetical protein [Caudoviricetes sp.]
MAKRSIITREILLFHFILLVVEVLLALILLIIKQENLGQALIKRLGLRKQMIQASRKFADYKFLEMLIPHLPCRPTWSFICGIAPHDRGNFHC